MIVGVIALLRAVTGEAPGDCDLCGPGTPSALIPTSEHRVQAELSEGALGGHQRRHRNQPIVSDCQWVSDLIMRFRSGSTEWVQIKLSDQNYLS